jgi:hypothetical protein
MTLTYKSYKNDILTNSLFGKILNTSLPDCIQNRFYIVKLTNNMSRNSSNYYYEAINLPSNLICTPEGFILGVVFSSANVYSITINIISTRINLVIASKTLSLNVVNSTSSDAGIAINAASDVNFIGKPYISPDDSYYGSTNSRSYYNENYPEWGDGGDSYSDILTVRRVFYPYYTDFNIHRENNMWWHHYYTGSIYQKFPKKKKVRTIIFPTMKHSVWNPGIINYYKFTGLAGGDLSNWGTLFATKEVANANTTYLTPLYMNAINCDEECYGIRIETSVITSSSFSRVWAPVIIFVDD